MDGGRLQGVQYVQLAPGTAQQVAPYVGVPAEEIGELVVEVEAWPDEIRPAPRRDRTGRLIAGDPVLLHAGDAGLLFDGPSEPALVPWGCVRSLHVLKRCGQQIGVGKAGARSRDSRSAPSP